MENSTEVRTEVAGNTNTATSKTRSRNWFITINNPTENDISTLKAMVDTHGAKYVVYQWEEVAQKHIHATICYTNPRVWPKKLFPTAHIEKVGNLTKCIEYCKKEESRIEGPYEFGSIPQQGRRTDLEAVAKKVVETRNLGIIAAENPDYYIRYHRGLSALLSQSLKHRTEPPRVYWFFGLSGKGKTRFATSLCGNYYIKDGTQWWDGYLQQKSIIIDDFDGRWPYRDFLRLLDRYPYQGQIKGGYVPINSPLIFITCEHPPHHFWDGNELVQVTRRLSEFFNFDDDREGFYDYIDSIVNYRDFECEDYYIGDIL